jgi:hypothetical protein
VETIPQGVEVVSTETWGVVARWDIPVSRVDLSPDGRYLVGTGLTVTDTLSTSQYSSEGAFIVRTDTMTLIGHADTPSEWYPETHFSPDSSYAYIAPFGGRKIYIVDLTNAEVIESIQGPEQLTVFGEPALLSTTRR